MPTQKEVGFVNTIPKVVEGSKAHSKGKEDMVRSILSI